jgi:hypothetical protein
LPGTRSPRADLHQAAAAALLERLGADAARTVEVARHALAAFALQRAEAADADLGQPAHQVGEAVALGHGAGDGEQAGGGLGDGGRLRDFDLERLATDAGDHGAGGHALAVGDADVVAWAQTQDCPGVMRLVALDHEGAGAQGRRDQQGAGAHRSRCRRRGWGDKHPTGCYPPWARTLNDAPSARGTTPGPGSRNRI